MTISAPSFFSLRTLVFVFSLLFFLSASSVAQTNDSTIFLSSTTKETNSLLIQHARSSTLGFDRLAHLSDYYGHRLSGSKELEQAIDWIVSEMTEDGFDKVWKQEVMVPHWERGHEYATLNAPIQKDLPMLGLGGSIGTGGEPITGEVIMVHSFEDLESKKDLVPGKIVLFNVPFSTYGQTVQYRVNGAIEAAKHGAIASIIASVASYSMQTPHTGVMYYEDGIPKIPHAAITIEDALLIERFLRRGETIEISLYMEAEQFEDAISHNVIAEIKGSDFPDELVVLGGHIDSWDVGQGAMDDGGGCVAAWEAARLIIESGARPKRTVRVVLWTNEENGLRGANHYADWAEKEEQSIQNHILAMESDAGVFDPIGFGFSGSDKAYRQLSEIAQQLVEIDAAELRKGGGGADIGPLMNKGVPGMGLNVESEKYFWYHHSAADTFDKLNHEDFNECVATMAAYAFGVADAEVRLAR
jgi:carboxypeptidase Q